VFAVLAHLLHLDGLAALRQVLASLHAHRTVSVRVLARFRLKLRMIFR
jgi:hypothetical protein